MSETVTEPEESGAAAGAGAGVAGRAPAPAPAAPRAANSRFSSSSFDIMILYVLHSELCNNDMLVERPP